MIGVDNADPTTTSATFEGFAGEFFDFATDDTICTQPCNWKGAVIVDVVYVK